MNSTSVRAPAVAGAFYRNGAAALRDEIENCFAGVGARGAAPKALVVPHAGYMYSGRIAAAAYATLKDVRSTVRRVVAIGPSHRVALRGVAIATADAFATPLGEVPIDAAARRALIALPGVVASDRAHAFEHSIEVQLPFLQTVLDAFTLVPLVAGDAEPGDVAAMLERVWGGAETLVVVSTDLSHFHDASTARALDVRTCRRILALDATLGGDDACGCVGLDGFLLAARRHALVPRQLAACNSGDVTGDAERVVGYAAFGFYPAANESS